MHLPATKHSTQPAHEPSPDNLPEHGTKTPQGSPPAGPIHPAGQNNRSVRSFLFLSQDPSTGGAEEGPGGAAEPHGAVTAPLSRAPLGPTCFCTSASLSAMAVAGTRAVTRAVAVTQAVTAAVAVAGPRRRAPCRRWPRAESDPVRVTAGGDSAGHAHRASGPIGTAALCDVTPPCMAVRRLRHCHCRCHYHCYCHCHCQNGAASQSSVTAAILYGTASGSMITLVCSTWLLPFPFCRNIWWTKTFPYKSVSNVVFVTSVLLPHFHSLNFFSVIFFFCVKKLIIKPCVQLCCVFIILLQCWKSACTLGLENALLLLQAPSKQY